MRHIVDTLIEERAASLMRNPTLWRAVRTFIYPLLGYDRAVDMADTIRNMSALEVFEYLSQTLSMDVRTTGLEYVPREGAAIIMPNHPAGIADGIAVFDALRGVRSDITFFANRDALRVARGLSDMIVPVEWVDSRRSHGRRKETVRHMVEAFRSERLVVIFPSGRLAKPTPRGLVEREWQTTAMNLALKYCCPVVPMHIKGHNSALYYFFYYIHTELRDMTLFRELLNKKNNSYELTLAEAFAPRGDSEWLTAQLRKFVSEDLPQGIRRFDPSLTESLECREFSRS
jgi:putative hemolysin